ncbi:MAG: NAD(+)/NADH kinase [Methanobacteriota archaeon]|nr:MAG: NAD(+)/NADH kinase [Euryarchaeota archaeon]
MRIGICAKPDLENLEELVKRVEDKLGDDSTVYLDTGVAQVLGKEPSPIERMDVDAVVTIGGDGTILRAMQRSNAKLLGINAGVMGFLTEVKLDDIETSIDRVLNNDYKLDERIKLKVQKNGNRLYDCLNEAVFHTAQVAKMRHFKITIDGHLADEFRADGMMIATPTGSTSYAMSAGGPIIDPRVEAMVLVPLAPFKLSQRPLVVPAKSTIELELIEPKECLLVLDGQDIQKFSGDERASITVSENKASFIRFREDFYARFGEKLVSQ